MSNYQLELFQMLLQKIWNKVLWIVKSKSNISEVERVASKKCQSNSHIIILSADKGNTTLLLDADDYNSKINVLQDGLEFFS